MVACAAATAMALLAPMFVSAAAARPIGDHDQIKYESSSRQLVITEVMQNPALTYDAQGEWFELYNPNQRDIDINGWEIGDVDYDTHTIDNGSPLVVPAGGYLVLGNNADPATNGGVPVGYSYGHEMFLFNQSDELILTSTRDRVSAHIAWDDGATFPDPKGASMALSSLGLDPLVGANWCTSTFEFGVGDLGTPGAPNICTQPENVVITEIMQNPNAASDGTGEWFEVLNQGSAPVDLAGWTIHDDDYDSHVIAASLVVNPGERAVLGRSVDMTLNGGTKVNYAFGDAVRLFNSWDELVLVNPAGLRVDRVKWNDGRSFPDPTGASMSVIDAAADNTDAANWCTATSPFGMGDLGTPGQPNTCSAVAGYTGPGVFITEILRNPVAVSDFRGEWFEVFNPNGVDLDLKGWVVRDNDRNFHVIDESVVVPAGGYAVLGRSASDDNGGVSLAYDYDNVILHNGPDELVLTDPTGSIVDQVIWNELEFPSEPGYAMALVDVAVNNSVGENWCPAAPTFGAGDRGTPGETNVCVAGSSDSTITITEMMVNPSASYDSVGEWVEVHNWGSAPIDLDNYVVKDEDFNEFLVDGPLIVEAGGYAVLGRESNLVINGGAELAFDYNDDMTMQNAGDEIVLLDARRGLVDRVKWGTGSGFSIPNGASLQVTDISLDNAVASSWCVALVEMVGGDAGTPGQPNNCDPAPVTVEEYKPEQDHWRCTLLSRWAIIGTNGDDVIEGTSGNDIIIAMGGDDIINGKGGNDVICAGPGNDTVDGGDGFDLIIGGSGDDAISAGDGHDLVAAGDGNDKVDGGDGHDSIGLGEGNDYAEGGSGNDTLSGGPGSDTLDGSDGRDHCDRGETLISCEW